MYVLLPVLFSLACPISANRAEGDSSETADSGDSGDINDTGDGADSSQGGDSGEDTDTDCDLVWYYDGDHDGYGDPAIQNGSCEAPVGYVGDNTDCDDARSDVYPGADELCDEVDQDCDTQIDEDAVDLGTFYADSDRDGFGDANVSTAGCAAQTDFVPDNTDCDDTDGTVFPGGIETCDGTDQDCNTLIDDNALGADTWFEDIDGDGYGNPFVSSIDCTQPAGFVLDDDDCDDANAEMNPAANETCDGVDQDCDGNIDEAATDQSVWYLDVDGDGFGTDALTYVGCEAISGYVAEDTDCDDENTAVSPVATEVCDGIDNDCNGTTDLEAADPEIWYRDADGDGFGGNDGPSMAAACDMPIGYVANPDDCDDASAASFPGGTEVCGGADENCDGATDEATAADVGEWYSDADADGYGSGVATTSCLNPGGLVDNADDCDDAESTTSPIASDVCDDVTDNDCNGLIDDGCGPSGDLTSADADASVTWAAVSAGGNATVVKRGGDLLGTGDETVLASRLGNWVWIAGGPASGTVDPALLTTVGDSPITLKGFASGDWDGDGTEDLALAISTASTAYIVSGPFSGSVTGATTSPDWSPGTSSSYGFDLHLVDLNGDGRDDLLSCTRNSTSAGWIDLGPYEGTLTFIDSGGPNWLDDCDAGPDVDGDGLSDLVFDFSVFGTSTTIVSGADVASGTLALTTSAAVTLVTAYNYDVALVPDTDGDGYADLVLGQANESAYAGEVELWLGPPSAMATGSAAATLSGPAVEAFAGNTVGYADVDGDELADVLIGGGQGEVWLQYSPISGAVDLNNAHASWSGFSVGTNLQLAGADLDGTGQDTIAIGDPSDNYYGAMYLFSGGGR